MFNTISILCCTYTVYILQLLLYSYYTYFNHYTYTIHYYIHRDAELGYFFRKNPNAKNFLKACGGIKSFCSQHGDLLRVVEISGKEAFLIRAVNVLQNSAKLGLL